MYTIDTFEDACDYIGSVLGEKFEKTLGLVNSILDNPDQYTGPQAGVMALRVSGYRVKLGLEAQHWKLKSAQTKKTQDRLIKDACLVLYDGLLELINSLKLIARHDHTLVQGMQ